MWPSLGGLHVLYRPLSFFYLNSLSSFFLFLFQSMTFLSTKHTIISYSMSVLCSHNHSYLHIWEWGHSTSPCLPPDGMWWCQPLVSWWSLPHRPQRWSSPAGNCPQSAWHSKVCQGQGTHYAQKLVMRRKRTRSSDNRSCVNEKWCLWRVWR